MIKQTYSAFVHGPGNTKKWHLSASSVRSLLWPTLALVLTHANISCVLHIGRQRHPAYD